ncbi:efflux RND transporter permease subunit [Nostoc sp. LPT]|uniref:efflux RND transporter permease subunit n=1 Tax=Nostoc sp. LPT TaxID=2815387 RepID=UPI0025FD2A40|nr:efflux RND transporter permease subunit [Nostoc sp. LPT]
MKNRNLGQGKPLQQAILDGAQQIAVPAFVSTLAICIVFIPIVFLTGVAQSLFMPLGMAVVFAMLASYLLSRTVVPMLAKFLLGKELHLYTEHENLADNGNGHISTQLPKKNIFWRIHEQFNRQFEKFRQNYRNTLAKALNHRGIVFAMFGAFWVSALVLLPFVGQDFFPQVDAGQFRLHVRAPAGIRLEKTEQIFTQVENEIRQVIPEEELEIILDNIGLLISCTWK